jgi:hypothetical protein
MPQRDREISGLRNHSLNSLGQSGTSRSWNARHRYLRYIPSLMLRRTSQMYSGFQCVLRLLT